MVFVVTLTYVAELSATDATMPRHMAYLRQQYAEDPFVAASQTAPALKGLLS